MMDAELDAIIARFPETGLRTSSFRDNRRLELPADAAADSLLPLMESLKADGYDLLCDVAGIDYSQYPDAADRYCVVYSLVNTATAGRLFVKAFANDPEPELPSVVHLWPGANWMEREVFDLFGVDFPGHPDLRRLLMPEGFVDHPLRKDYPLRGAGERHNFTTVVRSES